MEAELLDRHDAEEWDNLPSPPHSEKERPTSAFSPDLINMAGKRPSPRGGSTPEPPEYQEEEAGKKRATPTPTRVISAPQWWVLSAILVISFLPLLVFFSQSAMHKAESYVEIQGLVTEIQQMKVLMEGMMKEGADLRADNGALRQAVTVLTGTAESLSHDLEAIRMAADRILEGQLKQLEASTGEGDQEEEGRGIRQLADRSSSPPRPKEKLSKKFQSLTAAAFVHVSSISRALGQGILETTQSSWTTACSASKAAAKASAKAAKASAKAAHISSSSLLSVLRKWWALLPNSLPVFEGTNESQLDQDILVE